MSIALNNNQRGARGKTVFAWGHNSAVQVLFIL